LRRRSKLNRMLRREIELQSSKPLRYRVDARSAGMQ
jgi:hypothetical protein